MGTGAIEEQVARKRSERATCRGYYSCCTVLLLYCSLLHYKSDMSGFLSTWVGLLSNRVDLLSNRVGVLSNPVDLFLGERVLEIRPPPSLSRYLSSSPMGIFSRDYGTCK